MQQNADSDVEIIQRYWKMLAAIAAICVAWGINTQQIATAQAVNEKQEQKIEKIEDEQKVANGVLIKNTEAIKNLADKIGESTATNKQLLQFLLKQNR